MSRNKTHTVLLNRKLFTFTVTILPQYKSLSKRFTILAFYSKKNYFFYNNKSAQNPAKIQLESKNNKNIHELIYHEFKLQTDCKVNSKANIIL